MKTKKFLFLQGPHGPFFYELSLELREAGHEVKKIGFNAGDQHFWADQESFVAFQDPSDEWESFCEAFLKEHATDLVIYGDIRPFHAIAIRLARKLNIQVHCFEEGYLRPYWATYERGGVNGHSRLMDLSISEMAAAVAHLNPEQTAAPAHWGEMRNHMFLGAIYHWHVLYRNSAYPHFASHRNVTVSKEYRAHLKRAFLQPYVSLKSRRIARKLIVSGHVYHLALLQLSHDASIVAHSPFDDMTQFMEVCAREFARGAPKHHHLVFKSHPLEDDRQNLRALARQLEVKFGLSGRVHYVGGGKLARLLDNARSVVTINSTAAQQALWRSLPVRCLGNSVFRKPELTSEQPLYEFFDRPLAPTASAYAHYRRFLLATSQVIGGFYSPKSRARLIRQVTDMILAEKDPYEVLQSQGAAPEQQSPAVIRGPGH